MKKLISKFSLKLLDTQQLKAVKGGSHYCQCGSNLEVVTSEQMTDCNSYCSGSGTTPGGKPYSYPAQWKYKWKPCPQYGSNGYSTINLCD